MKRLLLALCLLASPLAAQPSRYSLATQVQPGFASTALGDTYYATGSTGSASSFGRIAPNTTSTRKFWMQASSAISWAQLVAADLPTYASKFIVQGTSDANLSGAQFLGALGTGILKNTTTTGVLSIAAAADLPSLLTTKGDLGCFSTVPARLGVGTDTYVLTADATQTCGFKWGAGSGGGGSVTTKGDLQTYSTVAARLPVGADGYALVADSTQATGLKYAAMTGAAGAPVGLVQIAQIVTSGSQATVDFTSIPAGYTDLEVRYQARSNASAATETMSVKINNDGTSGNYTITQYLAGTNAVVSAGTVAASVSGLFVNNITGATGTPASHTADGEMRINNYAQTTFYKHMNARGSWVQTSGAGQEEDVINSGVWKSTAAITRLTFSVSTSFVNGSTFTLYGTVTGGLSTVVLQPTTPGTAQTGNANLTGTVIAGGLTVTAAPTFSALTSGYLPKAGTAGLIGNSPVYTDGANVGIGTAVPQATLELTSVGGGLAKLRIAYSTVDTGYFGQLSHQGDASGLNIDAVGAYDGISASILFRRSIDSGATFSNSMIINKFGVGIGTTVFGTSAANVLGIANGTAPSTSPANMIQLWAEDVSSSSELRVRDEAGNVTTLSPHNFSMFTPAATQAFPWSYYSRNAHIGKEINVDMYGAIAALETLTGKKFIYVADLPADQIEDWTAQEATKKITVEKGRLDKAMAVEIEVAAKDAAESVAIMKEQPSATLTETVTTYALDAASGTVKPVVSVKPKSEQVATGKTEYRLKAGVRLDEQTGRFWRKTRADEAVVDPYTVKAPPAWIADRMKAAVK